MIMSQFSQWQSLKWLTEVQRTKSKTPNWATKLSLIHAGQQTFSCMRTRVYTPTILHTCHHRKVLDHTPVMQFGSGNAIWFDAIIHDTCHMIHVTWKSFDSVVFCCCKPIHDEPCGRAPSPSGPCPPSFKSFHGSFQRPPRPSSKNLLSVWIILKRKCKITQFNKVRTGRSSVDVV